MWVGNTNTIKHLQLGRFDDIEEKKKKKKKKKRYYTLDGGSLQVSLSFVELE